MLLPGVGLRAGGATRARARRAQPERLRGRGGRKYFRRDRNDAAIDRTLGRALRPRNQRESKTLPRTRITCAPLEVMLVVLLDRLIYLAREFLAAANLRTQHLTERDLIALRPGLRLPQL